MLHGTMPLMSPSIIFCIFFPTIDTLSNVFLDSDWPDILNQDSKTCQETPCIQPDQAIELRVMCDIVKLEVGNFTPKYEFMYYFIYLNH